MQTPGSIAKQQSTSKQMLRKKFSPNNKGALIVPPPVIYSSGVPKDVGFGRGDQQQQMTGVWLVSFQLFKLTLNFVFSRQRSTFPR
jgi:hypothetical protein